MRPRYPLQVVAFLLLFSLSLSAEEVELAPDFSLEDLEGQSYTLSELKGKVVMLDFWATWCRPCLFAIPELNRINSKFHKEDFLLLGINVDRFKSLVSLKKFVDEHKIDYPVLVDKSSRVAAKYRAFALPTSFLIDKEGRIAKKVVGYNASMAGELETEIRELLRSKSGE